MPTLSTQEKQDLCLWHPGSFYLLFLLRNEVWFFSLVYMVLQNSTAWKKVSLAISRQLFTIYSLDSPVWKFNPNHNLMSAYLIQSTLLKCKPFTSSWPPEWYSGTVRNRHFGKTNSWGIRRFAFWFPVEPLTSRTWAYQSHLCGSWVLQLKN